MRRFQIEFKETETGLEINSENEGFDAIELIGLLDLKTIDIKDQVFRTANFNRTYVHENGKKEKIEEIER